MKAIFDKNTNLVSWIDLRTGMIFDNNMDWIGFVENNNFFDTNADWIGGYQECSFLDKTGRPVAWVEGYRPVGGMHLIKPIQPQKRVRPDRPIQPIQPIHPLRPLVPLGGWSDQGWKMYIN